MKPVYQKLLSSFLILLSVTFTACSTVPSKVSTPATDTAGDHVEILFGTYNVYGGVRDFHDLLAVIRGMKADVVAMQEIAPEGAINLARDLAPDYPYRHFSNGLGVVSRYPFHNPRFMPSRKGINGMMFVELEHPRGRIQLANVHLDPLRVWTTWEKLTFPNQLWKQRSVHRSEIKQVIENLQPNLPTVILGDFNSATDVSTDKLSDLGYTDSFAAVTRKPDKVYTLNFSFMGIKTGSRIDYIFHNKAFETAESKVKPGKPSDHNPVISLLRFAGNPTTSHPPAKTNSKSAQ